MEQKISNLSKENLQQIILKMSQHLSDEQYQELEAFIEECQTETAESSESEKSLANHLPSRMSQEYVEEKLAKYKVWMEQIDEGELYLNTEEYGDYSTGYWDPDWITEYYDNQDIGDKIQSMIRFAKDCVDDRRYEEAVWLYEWLWDMYVSTDSEFGDDEAADLELLEEKEIIRTDLEQVALLTLYADYQVTEADKRAEDMYCYFRHYSFQKLHIDDMFFVGRETLTGTERFWQDWIALLKTKSGDAESRLLQEAILYHEGAEGLLRMADENCQTHPSLYLAAMEESEKAHDYGKIEEIGERALEKIDVRLSIRSKVALRAAYAASSLMHEEAMMRFCWESFRSDSTDKNLLRLFGTKEMAEKYGIRGKEVLDAGIRVKKEEYVRNKELRQNSINDFQYYRLSFYTGDFQLVRKMSKNPEGSLGWSSRFIREGIRLILLYLYERKQPSKAAAGIASYLGCGFYSEADSRYALRFEREIEEESRECEVSVFWNYFQRWKKYYPMEQAERKRYLQWAEKIVYGRADAIVDGQHRNHYGASAELLAMVAEIKEDMGTPGAKQEIFAEYKRKFPRHSSFQKEMKHYFLN